MPVGDIIPRENTVVEPETGEKPVIKVEPPQEVYETNRTIVLERRIIWYLWLVIEVLLFVRFLIHLFGANPWSFFDILISALTFPLVIVFSGLFLPTHFGEDAQIEWAVLFAMFFYLASAFVVARFFKLKKPVDPIEAEKIAKSSVI